MYNSHISTTMTQWQDDFVKIYTIPMNNNNNLLSLSLSTDKLNNFQMQIMDDRSSKQNKTKNRDEVFGNGREACGVEPEKASDF